MRKTAVVTDSNSGITQKQARHMKIHVVPMPFMMNGVTYFEDVDLSQEMFYEKLLDDSDISTSAPSPGDVTALWDALLADYEQVVHIPMSSGLSSSYQTANMLAQDYDGKVEVVNNQRISVTQRQSALDAAALAEAGWDAARIKAHLEEVKFASSIYIMVNTLKYLKKGGRVTAAGAALGSLLGIKPVLQIQGEKLDSYAMALGTKQARGIMIDAMRKDFQSRFSDFSDPARMWLQIAYTYDEKTALEFKEEVEAAFPGFEIHMDPLSLSVSCHIGPGALAIACSRKLVIPSE